MAKKERFFVWLPCKTYVKAWLVRNYSASDRKWPDGVNLSGNHILFTALKDKLRKPSNRYDKRMEVNSKYTERVPLEISEDVFYRNGWELTPTDINDINQRIEALIKMELRIFLEVHVMLMGNITKSIQAFYAYSGFSEATWPEESIRRYYYRNCRRNPSKNNVISEQISKIIMVNMSHK